MTLVAPDISDLPYRDQVDEIAKSMTSVLGELDEELAKAEGDRSAEDLERFNRKFAELYTRANGLKAAGAMEAVKAAARLVTPAQEFTDSMAELNAHASSSGIVNPNGRPMTLGEAFMKSPAMRDWMKGKVNLEQMIPDGSGTSPQIVVAGAIMAGAAYTHPAAENFDGKAYGYGADLDAKNVVTTAVQSGTRPLMPRSMFLPGFMDLAPMKDDLFMRQICTNISLGGATSWEYITITGRTNNAGVVPEALTAEAVGATSAHLTPSSTVVNAILAGVKPESSMQFSRVTGRVETIAHYIPVTRNAAMDAVGIMQEINAFLVQGIREKEETEFLFGTGTTNPPRLQGLLNTTNPYGIQTLSAGSNTDIDAVMLAIAKVRKEQYRPNWLVVNPDDWFSSGFLLSKNGQGEYLLANPRSTADQLNTLWGLQVLVTQSLPAGTMVVGDFRQALIADRMQTTLYVTDSHNDLFVRNVLVVLAEERVGFGCRAPKAFCQITP